MTGNERRETVHKYLFIQAVPHKEDGVYIKQAAGSEGVRNREITEEKEEIRASYTGDREGVLKGAVLWSLKC